MHVTAQIERQNGLDGFGHCRLQSFGFVSYLLFVVCFIPLLPSAADAMTTIGSAPKGFMLPFRVRGDLSTDIGWEYPYLSFAQNSELRLYSKHDITRRFGLELQLYLSYSNTDNQFSTSVLPGSFLDGSVNSFINVFTEDGGDTVFGEWQDLMKIGESVMNSQAMPQLSMKLDRINIRYKGRHMDLTLGKQVVAWGSGYAWNPTDVINTRNPLDPAAPRNGVGALVIDIPYREWMLFTFAMAPGTDLLQSTEGIRLKFMNRLFDSAFSLNFTGNSERALMNTALEAANVDPINELKILLGFDFITNLPWGINTWLEWSTGVVTQKLAVGQVVLGAQREFFGTFRLLGEIYLNSQGLYWDDAIGSYYKDGFNLDDAKARNLGLVALGDMGGIAASYSILGMQYPITPRWQFSFIRIMNTQDGSTGFTPQVSWQPQQSLKLETKLHLFNGNAEKTEFGSFKNSFSTTFKYLF